MKKWFLITIISIVTLGLTSVVFATNSGIFKIENYNVIIGNEVIKLQYPIFAQDSRFYISIRNLCDELGIPIHWNGENREIKVDIYNKKIQVSEETSFKEEGVIPDSETALIVGKAILEKYAEKPMEYQTNDKIYFLEVEFLEKYNAWKIGQTFKYKDKNKLWSVGGGFYRPNVVLNKQTGEVLYINTKTFFED